ncbi:24698_t:CDS:2 [Cetraspora pellucida]|uniref:24698_t:CDS:1 n=1 Tax=Cetraspora pellucida TaxID=1433469 RepID=A0A9N9CQ03_9GLOM|nr:24698_t:CDS:2 [Cetraspora pellucida]
MQPFNKYYPPDWVPEKGSVNKFVGKHPLGDRARKISQGILIVRFELPFNIWCEGCDKHVGKGEKLLSIYYSNSNILKKNVLRVTTSYLSLSGVRYNAEKKKIGNYYSTPIYSFRMKCHLCDNWIEIHTDPKNAEYVVVSGARQKIETWEPEDSETIQLKDEEEAKKLADNALYKLEHSVNDERKFQESIPILTQLQRLNERQWADPYTHSQKMRKKFREEKKELEAKKRLDDEIRNRNSLSIPLLPESSEDIMEAKSTEFTDHLLEQAQKRKLEVNTSSIFNKPLPKTKKSRFHANRSKNKVAQLSNIVSVNTKLKTDPFLKDNDWNGGGGTAIGKSGEINSDLILIKKKNVGKHNGNQEIDQETVKSQGVSVHTISLVSADYDDED